jgi:hypothetical protein
MGAEPMGRRFIATVAVTLIALFASASLTVAANAAPDSPASRCRGTTCTDVNLVDGSANLTAGDITAGTTPGTYQASRTAPLGLVFYAWRLRTSCQLTDEEVGACEVDPRTCPVIEGRVIGFYQIQRQRLAQPDLMPVDDVAPPTDAPPGTPYGPWGTVTTACVDVTDLNPPPSPAEVFRFFQTLPLPELATQQQPPGDGLVGLPVIFFTDSPTTQTFTVDIRGFDVDIEARAVQFDWHTGDGTTLTTTDPGAPHPDQTITHDYRAGTYTASLTTTWGGTFSVDGGASADVPGTTTTDGPPTTFTVLQARTVLTNPYD